LNLLHVISVDVRINGMNSQKLELVIRFYEHEILESRKAKVLFS